MTDEKERPDESERLDESARPDEKERPDESARPDDSERPDDLDDLGEEIGEKEARKMRARAEREESVWFGLGMFGLVGWSVAIPTVLFLALGLWIDRTYPSGRSWTLMMLVMGLGLGALNAWHWISQEGRKIERPERRRRD